MDAPIEWYRFRHFDRRVWRVYLSTPELSPELRDVADDTDRYGCCCVQSRSIYLDVTQPREELLDTLVHELLHASMGDLETKPEREETVVRYLTPRVLRALRVIGVALPPLPPAAELLARRTKEARKR